MARHLLLLFVKLWPALEGACVGSSPKRAHVIVEMLAGSSMCVTKKAAGEVSVSRRHATHGLKEYETVVQDVP